MKASFRQHGFLITSLITVVAKSPPISSAEFNATLNQVKQDATNSTRRSKYTAHLDDEIRSEFLQTWTDSVYGVIDGAHR